MTPSNTENRQKISLCMIVKNEEALLPQCLASVKKCADEIIVVDTGSTDGTIEIAESYGAKVYHHPWENNFSKHRNQSLSYASGDWILILDADEALAPGQGDRIREAVSKSAENCTKIYFMVHDIENDKVSMVTTSLRLFRNHVGAHYEGIVHNLIVVPKGESIKTDIILYHYGYALSDDVMEKKFHRTLALLKKQLEDKPADPYALYNMATLFVRRDPQKAVDYGLKLLSLLEEKGDAPIFYLNTFYILGSSFANMKQFDQSIDICLKAIEMFPKYVDAYWILCEVLFEKAEYERVIQYGNLFIKYLKYYQKNREELSDLFVYSYDQEEKVLLRLGLSCIYADDLIRGTQVLDSLFQKSESSSEVLDKVADHLRAHHPDFEKIMDKISSWGLRVGEQPGSLEKENTKRTRDIAPSIPKLSLCMIVKDEERLLGQCLESVRDCVDEIVIVDTGSTDRTVEIAKAFGARIFYHPWENDFSKHRNQSVGYATGDWIFILDADESLKREDALLVKEAVTRQEADSIAVTVINHFGNGTGRSFHNQIRLFRNFKDIRYQGIVHNRLLGCKATLFYPITIYHYGYDLAPERMKEKFENTSRLLKQRIKNNPEDYLARSQLAASYAGWGMHREAIKQGQKSIELANRDIHKGGDLNLWTHFIVSSTYLNIGQLEEAENYAVEALNMNPKHLDSHFVLAMVQKKQKDWEGFKGSVNDYLNLLSNLKTQPGHFGFSVNNTANEEWRIHIAWGDFCLEQGAKGDAVKAFGTALSTAPNSGACHEVIAKCYGNRTQWDLAEIHYRKSLDLEVVSQSALLGLARLYNLKGDLADYREIMDTLKKNETNDLEVIAELGIYELRAGRHDSAYAYFQKALKENPDDVNLHINMAVACKKIGLKDQAVEHNLKALDLKKDALEALVNLGHIYFNTGDYGNAERMYARALQEDANLVDVYLRLSIITLLKGDAESLLGCCDALLKILKIPVTGTLNDLNDLAEVFVAISHKLDENNKVLLSKEASGIAVQLNPMLNQEAVQN